MAVFLPRAGVNGILIQASASIAEDVLCLQFHYLPHLLQSFHVELFLVAQDAVVISTSLNPLLLEVDNLLQGSILHIVIQASATVGVLAEILRIDVSPNDGTLLQNACNQPVSTIPLYSKRVFAR